MACEGPVTVRDAMPGDAFAIAWVHVATWKVAYRGMIPDSFLAGLSVERREAVWHRLLSAPPERSAVYVPISGDSVVGIANIGPSRDEGAAADTGELYALYVEPACWGTGVGRLLMARSIEGLRSAAFTSATLWVLDKNTRAIDFYTKAGWSADGTERMEAIGSVEIREVRLGRVL